MEQQHRIGPVRRRVHDFFMSGYVLGLLRPPSAPAAPATPSSGLWDSRSKSETGFQRVSYINILQLARMSSGNRDNTCKTEINIPLDLIKSYNTLLNPWFNQVLWLDPYKGS